MLDARSPLGVLPRFERGGVVLTEAPDFTLTQIAGDEKNAEKGAWQITCKNWHQWCNQQSQSIFRVGAKQFWVLGEMPVVADNIYVTPLSSGRTRIQLEGARSRNVLSACALIDFSASQFKPGQFVLTGIHHTPVTIHCIAENTFHIYALRTFALNVWEWLCDIAEGQDHA